jgi:hypothetical protein
MSADDETDQRLIELAKRLGDRIDALKAERHSVRVVELTSIRGSRREPALTDAELISIRRMLAGFELIAESCPTARRLLSAED